MSLIDPMEAEARRSAGRPRCAQTHREILEAAADLLEREPYRNITVDRIASEAKVGKQTIYRWWPTKADVVLEAYLARALSGMPNASCCGEALADLRADLHRIITAMTEAACSTAMRGLFAEAQLDDAFRQRFHENFITSLHAAARPYLLNGVRCGQLRADLDIDLAIEILYGTVAMRFISGCGQLDPSFADELVDFMRPSLVAMPKGRTAEAGDEPSAILETDADAPAWVF